MAISRVNKIKAILSQETKTSSKPFSAEGKSIYAHDPKGKVSEAYRALTKEVLQLERQRQKAQSDLIR